MSKREKRLERIRRNPKQVRFEELDTVLQDFGFSPDFTAGSHITYRHDSGARVTVATHKTQLPDYIVKQALKAIDSLKKSTDDKGNDESEAGDDK